jgi:hypothetical protein
MQEAQSSQTAAPATLIKETLPHTCFQFSSTPRMRGPDYNTKVRLPARLPVLWFTLTVTLSAALSGLALWVYANARTPFGYMVVGALGTTVVLTIAFVWLWRRKLL